MAIADVGSIGKPVFNMGRVVRRTAGVVGHNFMTFTLLTLGVYALPMGLCYWSLSRIVAGISLHTGLPFFAIITGVLAAIAAFVGSAVAVTTMTNFTLADSNNRTVTLSDCLTAGLMNFLPIFCIAMLQLLGFFGGLILLVVPGIIFLLMWIVAVQVYVVEHTGVFRSFGRSRELTRGHRWAILGLLAIVVIIDAVLNGLLRSILGSGVSPALGDSASAKLAATYIAMGNWQNLLSIIVFTTINGVIGLVWRASTYYELRLISDGIGPDALASTFD